MHEHTPTHVALDDSKRKVVVGILRPGAMEPELREMPKEPHLIRRLFQRRRREGPVRPCYEAGVSGFDLYRQITACEVECQVIAPALTPRRRSCERRISHHPAPSPPQSVSSFTSDAYVPMVLLSRASAPSRLLVGRPCCPLYQPG